MAKVNQQNSPVLLETVPSPPQTTPPVQGGGDYSPYVWKQLGDIQQALGRLGAKIDQVDGAQKKADFKMEKIEGTLSGITHNLYAASVILTILVVIGGFLVNKAWDLMVKNLAEETPKVLAPAQTNVPTVGQQRLQNGLQVKLHQ